MGSPLDASRGALKGAADSGHQPPLFPLLARSSADLPGERAAYGEVLRTGACYEPQDPEDLEDDWLHYIDSSREIPEF